MHVQVSQAAAFDEWETSLPLTTDGQSLGDGKSGGIGRTYNMLFFQRHVTPSGLLAVSTLLFPWYPEHCNTNEDSERFALWLSHV